MHDAAVGQRFGDVHARDGFACREIGDGARHLEYAMIAARGELHRSHRFREQFCAGRFGRGDSVEQFAFGFGICTDPGICVTPLRLFARFRNTLGDSRGILCGRR
jgi:hypothetical protein